MELSRRLLRLLTVIGLAAAGLAALVSAPALASAGNPAPQTIPALRQWTGGTGTYAFGATTRIVRNTGDATTLAGTSQTFADDLKSLSGFTIAQSTGSAASPGDVYLSLGATDPSLGAEGYQLSVTDRITVTARTETGVFNGTRTILQLLHQNYAVPQGSAVDWPVQPERGLMVDDGRKFFTLDWLENQVRELAYLKLNVLHLHLSDNLGYRIESATHPEIVSPDHLSKQDITDLLALAAKYHVTVIPEIDMPGHMDTILAGENTTTPTHQAVDLRLKGSDGTVNNGYIDLSMPAAYSLMSDLINEYLPLFPGPYWHIGADEYVTNYSNYPQILTYARQQYGPNANAKDAYLGFVNWADGLVKAEGKQTRMWNDGVGGGSVVTVNSDVEVDFWYNEGVETAQQFLDGGHLISNQSWDPTYYVLGGATPKEQWGYETWYPDLFQGGQTINDGSKNLGSEVHVWCDNPNAQTQDQVASGIKNIERILAQQLWGSPKLVSAYSDFQTIISTVGRNPAWPVQVRTGDLALGRPTTASSVESGTAFTPGLATDGDYGTRWSSQYSDPQWIQVDLGTTQQIGEVKLTWEAAYGKAYQIQTSADGTTWTTIYGTTTGSGGVNDVTGLSGSGRYVRMYGTARGTSYGYSLFEFEVYGLASGGTGFGGHTFTAGGTADGAGLIQATDTGSGTQVWNLNQVG